MYVCLPSTQPVDREEEHHDENKRGCHQQTKRVNEGHIDRQLACLMKRTRMVRILKGEKIHQGDR